MNSQVRSIVSGANQTENAPDAVEYSMTAKKHRLVGHRLVAVAVVRGETVRGLPTVSRRGSALVASLFMMLALGGCGQAVQRVAVSGKVLLDGEPLTVGTIRFVPASGRPASSRILADGSFRVARKSLSAGGDEVVGLFPGNYHIAISATESLGEAEDAEVRWLVPRRYGDFRTSGLEADIQASTESMIVELTWEGSEETNTETGTEGSSTLEEDRETLEQQKDEA